MYITETKIVLTVRLNLLTENMKRIMESKHIRESLGGDNHHEEQCLGVPDVIDSMIHGLHSVPWNKK